MIKIENQLMKLWNKKLLLVMLLQERSSVIFVFNLSKGRYESRLSFNYNFELNIPILFYYILDVIIEPEIKAEGVLLE